MTRFRVELIENIPRLRRYAHALLGPRRDADDLVQDCLERACARADQWRQDSSLRTWLFSIMHNLFIDQTRRQGRSPPHQRLDETPEPGVEGQMEATRQVEELQQGLGQLPEDQRAVLLLVALEGLSYEEVAETLRIPLGTVMSRLYRARERMRGWLDESHPPRLRRVK